jgi:hypothetical protein
MLSLALVAGYGPGRTARPEGRHQARQIENTGFARLPVSIDASLLEMLRDQAGNAQPGIEAEPGARQGSRHQAGQIEPMPDFRPRMLSLALVTSHRPGRTSRPNRDPGKEADTGPGGLKAGRSRPVGERERR